MALLGKWTDITAYRRRGCIYVYAPKNKAFLLPDGQADVQDIELWEFIFLIAASSIHSNSFYNKYADNMLTDYVFAAYSASLLYFPTNSSKVL